MTEALAVEAIRGAMATNAAQAMHGVEAAKMADPDAVRAFQEAMTPTAVPFADQAMIAINKAHGNYQGFIHRIHELTTMAKTHNLSIGELSELQYEVANLSFQQDVVTSIAKKSANAIETLIKNQ